MRFIGHLDLMRCFQKIFRRAGIDISYSEGMSPHMIMSFAAPLGVGLLSEGEYVDIGLETQPEKEAFLSCLNRASVEGICFLDVFFFSDDGKIEKAMALVAAASYTVTFPYDKGFAESLCHSLDGFLRQDTIEVVRENKKAKKRAEQKPKRFRQELDEPENYQKTVNIRPMIHDLHIENDSVSMLVSCGSQANLRPDEVMTAFVSYAKGGSLPPVLITRTDLYRERKGASQVSFVPLGEAKDV